MSQYGLMKDATLTAYEIEVTDGTDPATTRILWPGKVTNRGTLSEEFLKRDVKGLGSGRSFDQSVKMGEEFEQEFESWVSEPFTTDSLIGVLLGTVDGGGVVTNAPNKLRTITLEHGWNGINPSFRVLKGSKIPSMSWAIRPNDPVIQRATIMNRILETRAFEVQASSVKLSDLIQTTLPPAHYKDVTVSFKLVGSIFIIYHGGPSALNFDEGETITGGTSAATGRVISTGSNHLLFEDLTGTFENAETITGDTSGRTATITLSPQQELIKGSAIGHGAVSGGPYVVGETITESVSLATGIVLAQLGDGLVYTPISGIFTGGETITGGTSGATATGDATGSFDTQGVPVRELDLTIAQNPERVPTLNGEYFASDLIEGDFVVSWSLKTLRENDNLLAMFRGRPELDNGEGRIGVKVVIDQGSTGFQMSVDMGFDTSGIFCIMREHELPESSDTKFLEQSFGGMLIGDPVVDLSF